MKNKVALQVASVLIACVIFWFVPLVRVVSLKDRASERGADSFNPANVAISFWNEKLNPSFKDLPRFEEVATAVRDNFVKAKGKFNRSESISDNLQVMAQLVGQIESIDGNNVVIALQDKPESVRLIASQRMVFGNLIRDASGLLNVNDFQRSEDWNALSRELNQIVERDVLSKFSNASVGDIFDLVVAVEFKPDVELSKPLKAVIVQATSKVKGRKIE